MKKFIPLFMLLCLFMCSCSNFATNDTYHDMSTGLNSLVGASTLEEDWVWLESKCWRIDLQYFKGKFYENEETVEGIRYSVQVKFSKQGWISSKTVMVDGEDVQKVLSEVVEKVKKEL